MRFLGVEPPRIPREASQATLDEILEGWKGTELKKAYRKRARETHPDTGGDEDEFKRVESAYREICEYAKLAAPRKRAEEPRIRSASPFFTGGMGFKPGGREKSRRHPYDAWRDSTAGRETEPRIKVPKDPAVHGIDKCLRCESARFGDYAGEANFCHRCGESYEDMTEEAIEAFKEQMNRVAEAMDGMAGAWAGFAEAFKKRQGD